MSKVGPPKLLDTFQEFNRTVIEFATLQAFRGRIRDIVQQGDGAPVMVLPGLGGNDATTKPLRGLLRDINYYVHAWRNGINIGPDEKTLTHLADRLQSLHRQHGRKVALVGHSLGGIYARELAREFPEMAQCVITLGSPFGAGAHPDSTHKGVRKLFELLNGSQSELVASKAFHARSLTPPPVPTTALYTRSDGIVHWKTCINPEADRTENIEIYASHCGLVMNPASALVIADRLAQNPESWKPFDHSRYPGALLPRRQGHETFTPPHPGDDHAGNDTFKFFRPPSGP